VRVDAASREVWNRSFGDDGYDEARAALPGPDGGWVVAGWTRPQDLGKDDGWVLALDDRGRVRWQARHGGRDHDRFHALAATPDGGYVAVGATLRDGARSWDGWMTKLDSIGRQARPDAGPR
jgi:hypothetical protein